MMVGFASRALAAEAIAAQSLIRLDVNRQSSCSSVGHAERSPRAGRTFFTSGPIATARAAVRSRSWKGNWLTLREENQWLRDSAHFFADLALCLNSRLRDDSDVPHQSR